MLPWLTVKVFKDGDSESWSQTGFSQLEFLLAFLKTKMDRIGYTALLLSFMRGGSENQLYCVPNSRAAQ